MKKILEQLYHNEPLSSAQASDVLTAIAAGAMNPAQVASFITVYLMRSITVNELRGFREAMLEIAIPFHTERDCIDLCGTGGDGKNTFNISTLSSFVVAACGVSVAKHGNYGVSSVSGSSNVMEYFGYRFTNDEETLTKQLDKCNICFLHAPLFHPAMKAVAPVRKELGVKTFFNMLGPLVNPARPTYRCTGVFSLQVARLYHHLLQQSGEKYSIIHSLDGYDEISLTGNVRIYTSTSENDFHPTDFQSERLKPEELFGGDTVEEAAKIFISILEGNGTKAQKAVVAGNSGIALITAHPHWSLEEAITRADESLQNGKALQTFKQLLALQS
ncbi:MAG: anthranilate phosphoribosyltransferase [Flavobacteriales bacterium]|nr:anthranilate phosphoribosyltransferase [Flavobacteriales bacterium]